MPTNPFQIDINQQNISQLSNPNHNSQLFLKICKYKSILLFITALSILSYILNKQSINYQFNINQYKYTHQDNTFQLQVFSKSNPTNSKWNITKFVWIYKSTTQQTNDKMKEFQTMNLLNTKYFAQQDNYKVIEINQNNFTAFLSSQAQHKIQSTLQLIEHQKESSNDQNVRNQINEHYENIRRRLIIYYLLLQNGGIYIGNKVTVVEQFSAWVEDVMSLPYINVGDKIQSKIQPKCFSFFYRDYSSRINKVDIKRQYEFEKKLILYPLFQDFFLACSKDSQYLQKLIEAYIQIITLGQQSKKWQDIDKSQSMIGKTQSKAIYQQAHSLAHHYVLQSHQHYLDYDQKLYRTQKKLAIDDLGYIAINTNLGPRKLQFQFADWNFERTSIYITKLILKQLQHNVGKIRFIYLLRDKVIQAFITHLHQPRTQLNFIVKDSYAYTYLLRHSYGDLFQTHMSESQILPSNKQGQQNKYNIQLTTTYVNQTQNLHNKQWLNLPKNLWIIWDSGVYKNSSFVVQLCAQNLKRSAKNSGFQLHIVNHYNVRDYLSQNILDRIQDTVKHATMNVNKATISDLWRLALLIEHGGIYVDSTTFTIEESYDWLLNITRIPSHFIFNRYGSQPNVFMFWNTYYRNEMSWKIDKDTKSTWHLSYESGFISAVKGSQFVKQWFDHFLYWMTSPYNRIQQQMKDVDMFERRWTNQNDRYLLVMDSVKYIVGKRQKMLQKQNNPHFKCASDYYKVWSIPGQMVGQLKLRGQSNYQIEDYRQNYHRQHTIYRFQYPLSYVEGIDSQIMFQSRFSSHGYPTDEMMMPFYHKHKKNFSPQKFTQIIHPQSILSLKLFRKYPQKVINILSYYDNLVSMRLKFKGKNNLIF